MKTRIHNKNLRRPFWLVWGSLLILSAVDLILAQFNTNLTSYFWGYLFIVNIFIVAMVYYLFGRPIFTLSANGDDIEISTGLSIFGFAKDFIRINRKNLIDFKVEQHGLKRYLLISFLSQNGIKSRKFAISFLSKQKIKEVKRILNRLLPQYSESDNDHLFI